MSTRLVRGKWMSVDRVPAKRKWCFGAVKAAFGTFETSLLAFLMSASEG